MKHPPPIFGNVKTIIPNTLHKKVSVCYDPEFKIVQFVSFYETNHLSAMGSTKAKSLISDNFCKEVFFDVNDLSEDHAFLLREMPRALLYNDEENKFYKRPFVGLRLIEGDQKDLSLNTEIPIEVFTVNVDNIDFWSRIDYLKVKDRNGFVRTPDRIDVSDFTEDTYVFNVKSAFPGQARLRVKDNRYLFEFNVLTLRFKQ